MATVVVILTSASVSPWVRPADFGTLVSVETIGGGASGACVRGQNNGAATGGGAGGYSKITADTIGTTVPFVIGAGGAAVVRTTDGVSNGNPGTATTWNGGTCVAPGGAAGNGASSGTAVAALGGQATAGTGTTKFSGGSSGACTGSKRRATGGGGAAGLHGNGNSSAAQAGLGATTGGSGDAGFGGAGGTPANANSPGGNGTEYTTAGSGGGGAGWEAADGVAVTAGSGGLYGGAGGGAGGGGATITSGAGRAGLIVITYTQAVTLPLTGRLGMMAKARLTPFGAALFGKLVLQAKAKVGPGMILAVRDELRTQTKIKAVLGAAVAVPSSRAAAQAQLKGGPAFSVALHAMAAAQVKASTSAVVSTTMVGSITTQSAITPSLLGINLFVDLPPGRITSMLRSSAGTTVVAPLAAAATSQTKLSFSPATLLRFFTGAISAETKTATTTTGRTSMGASTAMMATAMASAPAGVLPLVARIVTQTKFRLQQPLTIAMSAVMIFMAKAMAVPLDRVLQLAGVVGTAAKGSGGLPGAVPLAGTMKAMTAASVEFEIAPVAGTTQGQMTMQATLFTRMGTPSTSACVIYGDACGCEDDSA